MRTYVLQGLRGGRPIAPLVTYNTWYAYGTAVDDESMRLEMARAASMGVELFVIDAGWYIGADTKHTTNFTPGLGTWTADPDRFPDGLGALSAFAHSLGMKFGVWVEPERVGSRDRRPERIERVVARDEPRRLPVERLRARSAWPARPGASGWWIT